MILMIVKFDCFKGGKTTSAPMLRTTANIFAQLIFKNILFSPNYRPDDWCPHTSGVPQHRDGNNDRTALHLCGALQLHRTPPGPLLQRTALPRPVQKWRHLLLRVERPLRHAPHHRRPSDVSNERQLPCLSHAAGIRLHAPLLPVQNHHTRWPDPLQLRRRERLHRCGAREGVSFVCCWWTECRSLEVR